MFKTLASKFSSLKVGLKESGIEFILTRLCDYLPPWLHCYKHAIILEAEDLQVRARKSEGYDLRRATIDDVDLLLRLVGQRQTIEERFARGDSCTIVLKEGEIVAFCWATHGKLYDRLGRWTFDSGEDGFFGFDIFVTPEERLRGFFNSLVKIQVEHFRSMGRTKLYTAVSALNRNSLKSHKVFGMKICGEVIHFTLLGIRFNYFKYWPRATKKLTVSLREPSPEFKRL